MKLLRSCKSVIVPALFIAPTLPLGAGELARRQLEGSTRDAGQAMDNSLPGKSQSGVSAGSVAGERLESLGLKARLKPLAPERAQAAPAPGPSRGDSGRQDGSVPLWPAVGLFAGAALGGYLGSLAGPVGGAVGAIIGAVVGYLVATNRI